MKLAITGQQEFGRAVFQAFRARGDEVAGVFCEPDKPGAKKDALRDEAQAQGVPVFQFPSLRSSLAQQALRDLDVDIGIMAYVLQFAPQAFVGIPRFGTIQYHPSLLPKHRGPSSINWPIALGETMTGITIFRPTDGLDEGPVILQKSCVIGPDDTLGDVYFGKLFPMGVAALLEAADLVLAHRHEEKIQDESQAGYEGWFTEAEARIHWAQHVDIVHNLIRACNPAPGAWCELAGVRVQVYDVRKHPVRNFAAVAGKPGEIAAVTEDSIEVNANGGRIEILRLRPQGGSKMSAGEFAKLRGLRGLRGPANNEEEVSGGLAFEGGRDRDRTAHGR
ncbi:MAG TPA: methionyl-tRNA formyltransferase [Ramlibacter sp.]|uniref:methionyl-tRNA formyltransferase n=1 Tax=Ramlibacter sp. TaxID=1917967 RepID=UPI002CA72393|nr:methionyl-tRNA formyltransferase [Ramlibacter sp.]HVZ44734.1 methionyl-tRNA formyltransferase [Ramlibacter sp.]